MDSLYVHLDYEMLIVGNIFEYRFNEMEGLLK
ncbi:MAG: hypothetical protein ACI9UJ_002617 [bacterium]|jgi:hypothetical protein